MDEVLISNQTIFTRSGEDVGRISYSLRVCSKTFFFLFCDF